MDLDLAKSQQVTPLEIGSIDDIPPGQGRCFTVKERSVAVFRTRNGRVFALDNACPHRQGPLSEGVIGIDFVSRTEAVMCPFHSYKFSLRDGRGVDTELRVRSYAVKLRNGRILIALK